jgi:two-component system, NtrC family, sensor kinase
MKNPSMTVKTPLPPTDNRTQATGPNASLRKDTTPPAPALSPEAGPSASAGLRQNTMESALLARPGFSVRARLTLGFLLFFVISTGVTLTAWFTLNRLGQKMTFLEIADRYTTEIQQARRFEKNYFLYGTNLQDVLDHVQNASRLLTSGKGELESVIGEKKFRAVENHLEKYSQLLQSLQTLVSQNAPSPLPKQPAIEAALREHGAAMVSQALELAEEERKAVELMLKLFKRLPLVFLAILLPLIIYTANFLARQILSPLGRLLDVTERIAHGDFTPIAPVRRFRDEFTNLSIALNHMMQELEHRHEMLVKSHKLRAVGTLTAGIAHELNNPINNITLTSAMLEEDYKTLSDEERMDMIHDLTTQAERASRIVRNLLDFARESEMESELVDVSRLLQETLQLASNEFKLKKVKVDFHAPDNLPPIYGDKQNLSQIFLNLALNALDAMPGGGLLRIRIEKSPEPGFISVELRDNGNGIPEHILPNIFDPFFTTKRRGKGTGLGLSVSLGIVKKHGGDIRVQSQPGQGTTFTVLLPITAVPAEFGKEDRSLSHHPGRT